MGSRKDWKAVTQDYSALQNYDNVEPIALCLTQREVAIIKASLTPAYWTTRWTNLSLDADELYLMVSALDSKLDTVCGLMVDQLQVRTDPAAPCVLQQSPDGGIEWYEFANIEDCIVISPTILQIDIDITNNTTNIDVNETNIIDNSVDITLINTGDISINVYPPPPTQSEPDELCGAAWYIAEQLDDYIQQTIIDEGTMTLGEWLVKVLALSGLFGALAAVLWDFIAEPGHPDLSTEVSDAIEDVAEAVYCAVLDRTVTATNINANPAITADAKEAYIDALDSVTDGTLALWSFVGSLDLTRDCTSFSCVCPGNVFLYPGDPNVTIILGTDEGAYWQGVNSPANTSTIELGLAWANCTIVRVQAKMRAIYNGGGEPGARNVLQYLNGGLLSEPPYDTLVGAWEVYGEDISPFAGGYLEWMVRIGWTVPNDWDLQIEYFELVIE